MATAAKTKNGRVTADAVADVASRFTEEAKAVTDTWFDITDKVAGETRTVLDTQQKLMQDGFATWQEYNQANLEFFTKASQQLVEESLTTCERWSKMNKGNWNKAQKLWLAEQEAAVKRTEAVWTQTQAASERLLKLFIPVFNQE